MPGRGPLMVMPDLRSEITLVAPRHVVYCTTYATLSLFARRHETESRDAADDRTLCEVYTFYSVDVSEWRHVGPSVRRYGWKCYDSYHVVFEMCLLFDRGRPGGTYSAQLHARRGGARSDVLAACASIPHKPRLTAHKQTSARRLASSQAPAYPPQRPRQIRPREGNGPIARRCSAGCRADCRG